MRLRWRGGYDIMGSPKSRRDRYDITGKNHQAPKGKRLVAGGIRRKALRFTAGGEPMGERGVLPQTQLNIKIYQRAQLIRWHFLCSNPFRAGCFFLNLSVTETKTGTKAQQSNHKFLAFCDKRRNFAF